MSNHEWHGPDLVRVIVAAAQRTLDLLHTNALLTIGSFNAIQDAVLARVPARCVLKRKGLQTMRQWEGAENDRAVAATVSSLCAVCRGRAAIELGTQVKPIVHAAGSCMHGTGVNKQSINQQQNTDLPLPGPGSCRHMFPCYRLHQLVVGWRCRVRRLAPAVWGLPEARECSASGGTVCRACAV